MIIKEFSIEPCVLRKADPTWRTSLHADPTTEGAIIRLQTDDGHWGDGYGSATAHMGSVAPVLKAELEFFRPGVIGEDARRIEAISVKLDRMLRGASFARSAIECALFDLNARALGVPLNQLLGGQVRDRVPVIRILAIKTPEEMARAARKLVDEGYRYLKIKVEGDVATDIARVAAIRREVGEAIHLTIDANQAYSVKSAIRALNGMAEFGLELAEQPIHVDDLEGLALVTRSVSVIVEADEAAGSLKDIHAIIRGRCADAVSLKLPKLGGLRNAIMAARLCEANGIKYRLGAAVGSRILVATGLHLACALPGMDYACELGEFERLLDDPFEGLSIVDGDLLLPTSPGLGITRRQPQMAGAR